MSNNNLDPMYGNAGYKFPRTTQEAFGPGATIFVATEDDDEEINETVEFSIIFGMFVYTLAAIVIGYIVVSA